MFAWLMITLLAGFGGIITISAFKETAKIPVGEYRDKG